MLLCVDVGNSNITFGIYKDKELIETFRMETKEITSLNQLSEQFSIITNTYSYLLNDFDYVIIDSVVPRIDIILEKFFIKNHLNYMFIDYNSPIGIDIKIDNPSELGSDLLVGAYQAYNKYGGPCLVVDMGTATTLFLINKNREFLGGVIYPGVLSSFGNLLKDTSKLNMKGIDAPSNVIGRNTNDCLQSGMLYGSSEAINGLINLIKSESGIDDFKIIITGGIASFLHPYINNSIYDENLLLDGLCSIYESFIKKSLKKY